MTARIFVFDYETYYGTGCNIKSLGTSQYVGHEEFEVICLGVKEFGKPETKVLMGDEVGELFERFKELQRRGEKVLLCGHNMHFDGYISSYHYGFIPDYYLCTYSMARPILGQDMPLDLDTLSKHFGGPGKIEDTLDEWRNLRWEDATTKQRQEMVKYCLQDVQECERVFKGLAPDVPKLEMDIIDLTIRKFTDPVAVVDVDLAEQIIAEEQEAKRKALAKVGVDDPTVVRSNPQFAALLEEHGYEVPMKWSEKQAKEVPAFSKSDLPFQRMQNSDDPFLRDLINARLVNKSSINESRAKAFLMRSGGPVPIYLRYCAAHTMRWGGGDKFNPQNMPRDGKLRNCVKAPEGHVFVIADASQIEARDTAVFSGQEDLVESFRAGNDVYAEFAQDIYGYPVNAVDNPLERFVGKTGILGLGYGCGRDKFHSILTTGGLGPPVDIEPRESAKIVELYRSRYYNIPATWRELQGMIAAMLPEAGNEIEFRGLVFKPGKILMPNGLHLNYPNLYYTVGRFGTAEFFYRPWNGRYKRIVDEKLYGGLLLENIIQCRARIMTAEHMMILSKYYRVMMMAHDEIVMCVPTSQADQCLRDALEVMSIPPRWNES